MAHFRGAPAVQSWCLFLLRLNPRAWFVLTDPSITDLGHYVEHLWIDSTEFNQELTKAEYCALLGDHLNYFSASRSILRYRSENLLEILNGRPGRPPLSAAHHELINLGYRRYRDLASQQTSAHGWALERAVYLPKLKAVSLLNRVEPRSQRAQFLQLE